MTKISFHILFTISVIFSQSLFAQEYVVSGVVSRQESLSAVVDADVFVEKLNRGTSTDSQGRFKLTLPRGNHRIDVFSFGLQSTYKMIEVNADLKIDFFLSENLEVLNEVEVIETRESLGGITRLRAVDGFGIYEAKKNEVIILNDFASNKANTNARQIFAKVPGLNIWESDFAGLQLDIAARGLGPSRTANFNTRQNGYDMSADALGYPESYYLPSMQAVDRIEIVRGAASLQYGTQFGGMLNFKLKDAPAKPFELQLDQSVGSFGLLNSFVSAGGTAKKLDYYSYYNYRTGDGWRENSEFDAHLAFGRINVSPNEKLKLGFEYSYMYYLARQPGGLTDDDFESGDFEASRRDRNWFRVSWNLMANTIDYRFSDRTKLNVRNFALLSQRDALGDLLQITGLVNPQSDRTLIRDNFRNFGSEIRLLHRYSFVGKSAALVAGARFYKGFTNRKQGFSTSRTTDADFSFLNPQDPANFDYDFPSLNNSYFLESLINLNDRLSITPGIRFEYISTTAEGQWRALTRNRAGDIIFSTPNTEDRTDTRGFVLLGLGGSYYINPSLNLYANISQNYRSITFSDLRIENPNFKLDSLITDERGFNSDIGMRGALTRWLNIDASLFLLQYNNRIGETFTTESSRLLRTNIGDSRHLGLETFIEADIFKFLNRSIENSSLSLFTNFSFLKATYIRGIDLSILGRRVEYVPEVMLRAGINYRYGSLKAGFQYSYLGDQFSDATNSISNPNPITGIIPSYDVLDLSFEYALSRYKFTCGINNILNEKYFTRRAVSYPGPGIIPATIRSFYFSAGATF
ncbi:MAG: TonB-dependent receptor [Bacteroidota bacterium]